MTRKDAARQRDSAILITRIKKVKNRTRERNVYRQYRGKEQRGEKSGKKPVDAMLWRSAFTPRPLKIIFWKKYLPFCADSIREGLNSVIATTRLWALIATDLSSVSSVELIKTFFSWNSTVTDACAVGDDLSIQSCSTKKSDIRLVVYYFEFYVEKWLEIDSVV